MRTGDDAGERSNAIETELRVQLEQSRAEVDFLREELTHRRQTDNALATVIEAFKLNAETTRAQLMGVRSEPRQSSWAGKRHDIVHSDEPDEAA